MAGFKLLTQKHKTSRSGPFIGKLITDRYFYNYSFRDTLLVINACKYSVLSIFYSNLPGYTDAFTAMKFALESQRNQSKNDFKFLLTMAKIDTIDAYKLSRIICTQVNL